MSIPAPSPAANLPVCRGAQVPRGTRRKNVGRSSRHVAAAASTDAADTQKPRGRRKAQAQLTAEELKKLAQLAEQREETLIGRRAVRMGKDVASAAPQELLSPRAAFVATLPKFLVHDSSSVNRLDFGVAGEGKELWWGIQLDDSKHARRFTEYLEKQLDNLVPPGSPVEVKRRCGVWLPKRTVKAWSEKTGKMGNRTEVWNDGVILIKTVMDNAINQIVQSSTAVAGWHKAGSIPDVDAVYPIPLTEAEVEEVQQWEDEVVILQKEDVLEPDDSRLRPQKELNPFDDPRLVEAVDLKTGQKKMIYRDEEADRRRAEAKARRQESGDTEGRGGRRSGQGQPQGRSAQIGISRADMGARASSSGRAEESRSSAWNVGIDRSSRRGKGPPPTRGTSMDWNIGHVSTSDPA
ncbi:hypothetical protein WJX84_007161, partial [Apatococcus fuscideae]